MSCRYKDECPSYSVWCEGPRQDFSRCIQFLITAYERAREELKKSTRLCKVGIGLDIFTHGSIIQNPLKQVL